MATVVFGPELRKDCVKTLTQSTATTAKWSKRMDWPDGLKENRVKTFTRIQGKLCKKVDEISASLFGPKLMKNCVKMSAKFPKVLLASN
jgi:hypothetical protein